VEEVRQNESSGEDRFRRFATWTLAVMVLFICSSVFYAFVRYGRTDQFWIPVTQQHFAAIVGLPMALLASFIVVLVLRVSAGPIEFEAWGLKFKGASAPIVFWILCFLSIAVSIKMLW